MRRQLYHRLTRLRPRWSGAGRCARVDHQAGRLFEEKAIDQAAGFPADDSGGVGAVLAASDQLADDPRPRRVVPLRIPDLRRLRVGWYRVIYEIKGDVVASGHIARRKPDR
jgi:mRNA interferase RelE/StbE